MTIMSELLPESEVYGPPATWAVRFNTVVNTYDKRYRTGMYGPGRVVASEIVLQPTSDEADLDVEAAALGTLADSLVS